MITAKELLKQGRRSDVWSKYCGFYDIDLQEFMKIQNDLLLEQIQLLSKCELGKKLMNQKAPQSVDAFRKDVPLTKYEDYEPYLTEKREDVLPSKPITWARTSGRSSSETFKWAPIPNSIYTQFGEAVVASLIVSSCSYKGDVKLEPGDILLMMSAPPPYVSGIGTRSADEQMDVRFVPPLDKGEKMEFAERIAEGFNLAMRMGLDYFYGLSSLLAAMGERFESGSTGAGFSTKMLHPAIIFRLVRAVIRAKLNKRSIAPSDIWNVKGIVTGGADTEIFRDKIKQYWGKMPLEAYGTTEGGALALQAWNFKGMTLVPNTNFYEFIPQDEHIKNKQDPNYEPKTILVNEVTPGIYELVLTNLRGGIFTRYRIGDLIEVTSLRDDEAGIDLPQIRFHARADDIIDLGGFARLTEKLVWSVIQKTDIEYVDWCARKEESDKDGPIFHIYLELKPTNQLTIKQITTKLNTAFREISQEFIDLEDILGSYRLHVTQLREGAFARYIEHQQESGADVAHIKPSHMQPSNKVVEKLLTR